MCVCVCVCVCVRVSAVSSADSLDRKVSEWTLLLFVNRTELIVIRIGLVSRMGLAVRMGLANQMDLVNRPDIVNRTDLVAEGTAFVCKTCPFRRLCMSY